VCTRQRNYSRARRQPRSKADAYARSRCDDDEAYFNRFGFSLRHIPELDRERSEVSRYKGVFAKDLDVV
jgi:hypothetical protein